MSFASRPGAAARPAMVVATIGLVCLSLGAVYGCDSDPEVENAAGGANLRSPAKTSACMAWCEREKAALCPGRSPSLDDCASHCEGEAGCGDAAPLLACLDEEGAPLQCAEGASSEISVSPPAACFGAFKAYYDALPACKSQAPPDVGSGPHRDR